MAMIDLKERLLQIDHAASLAARKMHAMAPRRCGMFFFEFLSWMGLSLLMVMLHIRMTPGQHARPALTAASALMWAATGGLLGTVIRLERWDTGGYSVLSLSFAGLGTLAFLLLEWMGSKEHLARS